MGIPVFINNFNLLTWPKKMVEDLKTFDDIGEIIIFDNNSTYEPLLEWYETKPCEIVRSDINYGQSGVWLSGTVSKYNSDYYVMTDPDMDLSNTPKDCLVNLKKNLEKNDEICRIGLSICNFWDNKKNSAFYYVTESLASQYIDRNKLVGDILMGHIIDTTFAMYVDGRNPTGLSCALDFPYCAGHLPWDFTGDEIENLSTSNNEYYYYMVNAGYPSSFKRTINFENRLNEGLIK